MKRLSLGSPLYYTYTLSRVLSPQAPSSPTQSQFFTDATQALSSLVCGHVGFGRFVCPGSKLNPGRRRDPHALSFTVVQDLSKLNSCSLPAD